MVIKCLKQRTIPLGQSPLETSYIYQSIKHSAGESSSPVFGRTEGCEQQWTTLTGILLFLDLFSSGAIRGNWAFWVCRGYVSKTISKTINAQLAEEMPPICCFNFPVRKQGLQQSNIPVRYIWLIWTLSSPRVIIRCQSWEENLLQPLSNWNLLFLTHIAPFMF